MRDNRIKKPMIAAIILQAIAVAIGLVCYLGQSALGSMRAFHLVGRTFPDALISLTIILLLHIVCLLVMQTSDGKSNRTTGIIMTVVYCAVNILSTYVSRMATYLDSRKGAEYLASKSVLSSVISLFTSPLSFISLVLAIIAIGRFGILGNAEEE